VERRSGAGGRKPRGGRPASGPGSGGPESGSSAAAGWERGRWITPEGYARLQAELRRLWTEERPRATRDVQQAAAHGDRSENAEYQYGKRRLREIDRRLRQLSRRLESLQVIEPRGLADERVRFGAWVTVRGEL
jgi:Transcription elongation factor, N-terminal